MRNKGRTGEECVCECVRASESIHGWIVGWDHGKADQRQPIMTHMMQQGEHKRHYLNRRQF